MAGARPAPSPVNKAGGGGCVNIAIQLPQEAERADSAWAASATLG
jgi:hypothetical protein